MNRSIIEQLIEEELNKRYNNNRISELRDRVNKINSYGKNISKVGDFLGNDKISAFGNNIQNGTSAVNNVLNKPSQYAQNAVGNGISKAGNYFTNQLNAEGFGNALSNVGNYLTSNAAATGAGTTAGTVAAENAAAGLGAEAAGTAATTAGTTAATTAGTEAGATAGGSALGGSVAGGPIAWIAALAAMALTGANRKRAKSSNSNTKKLAEASIDESDNQTAQAYQNAGQLAAQSSPMIGGLTGGAANAQNENSFPQTLEQFQKSLKDVGWDDNTINAAMNGLNLGNKDMSDYINAYNSSAADGQQIRIPQSAEEIELARNGNFNTKSQQSGEVSVNDGEGWLNKLANGLEDLRKGYKENRENAFNPDNLRPNDDKNKMTRTGEFLGSLARIAQTPAAQGLIAGGLSALLTGNLGYGLKNGYNYANQRAMSNIYNKALKEQGIDVPESMWTNTNKDSMNALLEPKYKNEKMELDKLYKNYMIDKMQKDLENKQRDLDIKEYKAKHGTTVTHVSTGGGSKRGGSRSGGTKGTGNTSSTNERYVKMLAPNNKVYNVPESQIKRYKAAGGKIVG